MSSPKFYYLEAIKKPLRNFQLMAQGCLPPSSPEIDRNQIPKRALLLKWFSKRASSVFGLRRLHFLVSSSFTCLQSGVAPTRPCTAVEAKSEGKYKGRAPTARAKSGEVLSLLRSGVRATDVAKQLGIGRRSVYRIIEATKA